MPKVTIEYDLPDEKDALEHALMGTDALTALEALQRWIAQEIAARGSARTGSGSHEFRRGVEACSAQLEELLAPSQDDGEHKQRALRASRGGG